MANPLTRKDAEIIERECALAAGSLALDRDRTQAEETYLSLELALPPLAVHVDYLPQNLALVIYEQEIGEHDPVKKPYLSGATFKTAQEAMADVSRQWAGLVVARNDGMTEQLGEGLAVTFTGWVSGFPNQRFSWSLPPKNIRNVFSGAGRALLLGPQFEDVPPVKEKGDDAVKKDGDDGPGVSPGQRMKCLTIQTIVYVHSVLYQGTTSLRHHDGGGLMDLAVSLEKQ